jgi:hypothetical protein
MAEGGVAQPQTIEGPGPRRRLDGHDRSFLQREVNHGSPPDRVYHGAPPPPCLLRKRRSREGAAPTQTMNRPPHKMVCGKPVNKGQQP